MRRARADPRILSHPIGRAAKGGRSKLPERIKAQAMAAIPDPCWYTLSPTGAGHVRKPGTPNASIAARNVVSELRVTTSRHCGQVFYPWMEEYWKRFARVSFTIEDQHRASCVNRQRSLQRRTRHHPQAKSAAPSKKLAGSLSSSQMGHRGEAPTGVKRPANGALRVKAS